MIPEHRFKIKVTNALLWLNTPPECYSLDTARIYYALLEMGLTVDDSDCYRIWEWWSDCHAAQWLTVPTDPEKLRAEVRLALETMIEVSES